MSEAIGRILSAVLIIVHAGLGVWAFAGFAELVFAAVPWPRLSNPLFSPPMLLLQWTLITVASIVFIAGYLGRWKYTPVAMLSIYTAMALVCAYQTFFILTHPTRFRAMAVEYIEYTIILLFLFFSAHMRLRFS